MSTKYVSGRVKELKIGISNYSESKESLSVTGIVSATKYSGDGSDLVGVAKSTVLEDAGINTAGTTTLNQLVVSGFSTFSSDVRVSGMLTVGASSLTFDGDNDIINVGTGLTLSSGGVDVSGIVTASSIDAAISEWVLGANGSSDYTFTGPGLTGAENDPTIYLKRGQKYRFKNASGGHPFRIQSTVNGSAGSAYNDGITNNDAGNGTTLIWDVQFDAPDVLYYQCTAHGSMGGKIYIGNSGDSATINNLKVTGVSTYQGDLDIESQVLITGITTVGGLVDINAGGQANTFKVEDLTDNRVVIVGTGGELEDDANLTFNGTTFNVGSGVTIYQASGIVSATKFHGDGSSLTGIDASALKFGGVVKAQANVAGVVITGILTGNGSGLTNVSISGINTSGTSDFTDLYVSGISTFAGDVNFKGATGITSVTWNKIGKSLDFVNDARLRFGKDSSEWMNIYKSGNTGNGAIELDTGDFYIKHGTDNSIISKKDGAVELNFDNVKKFETTNLGVDVTGTVTASAFAGDGSQLTNLPGIDTAGGSTFNNVFSSGINTLGKGVNGKTFLYHADSLKFETTNSGVSVTGGLTVSAAATFAGGVDVSGGSGLVASTAKISDLTDNRVVIVGTTGELEDTTKLTFDGSTLAVVGDATFTGNVSVAGTLTSEDKTNIDSLGIVTARTGVRITSGGLIVNSGVSTFTDAIDSNGGANVAGGLVANSAKVSDLTSGRVVVAGTAGELEDDSTFTFSGGTVSATAFSGTNLTGTLQTAAQANVTSVGTLTGLNVSGDSTFTGVSTFKGAVLGYGAAGVTTFMNEIHSNKGSQIFRFRNDSGATQQGAISVDGSAFSIFTHQNGSGSPFRIYQNGWNYIFNTNQHFEIGTGTTINNSGANFTGIVTAGNFNSTSDIRLKDNIQVIEDPLAKIVQIEGVSFNWKVDNRPALGVIADQVQEILPELVTDGDPKTVNYNGLIGLLIEAVKEQQIQINELKSKLP